MKNIIEIDVTIGAIGSVKVIHNDKLIKIIDSSGQHIFDIDANNGENTFLMVPLIPIKINQMLMFGLGKNKLVYRGLCCDSDHNIFQSQDVMPGSVWKLDYQTPVFTWLHHALDYGWLVKE
jgi:hypothetical protein